MLSWHKLHRNIIKDASLCGKGPVKHANVLGKQKEEERQKISQCREMRDGPVWKRFLSDIVMGTHNLRAEVQHALGEGLLGLRVDQLQSASELLRAVKSVGVLKDRIKCLILTTRNGIDDFLKLIGLKKRIQLGFKGFFLVRLLSED